LPGRPTSLLDLTAPRGVDESPGAPELAAPISLAGSLAGDAGWHVVAAAVGLAIVAAASPIAVTALAASGRLSGMPLAASAIAALLIAAPAGVGLLAALSGLRRIAAALAAQRDVEAEQAVLRIFVDTLVFFYALGLAALTPGAASAALYVPVAALALVAAWAGLAHMILWQAAPPWRRFGATALDIVLFSAFLHFGGSAASGWYPLYLVAILYAGWRFGREALVGTALASVAGFAAVVASTEIWRQQPVLTAGLLGALVVLPALVAGTIRAMEAARAEAAGAQTDRRHILTLIADALGGPSATAAPPRGQPLIADILDFAALEAGQFDAPVESFDLRALVRASLMPLLATAAEKQVGLRWRVDPRLPRRLRGHARALARVLGGLAGDRVAAAEAGTIHIELDAAACEARRIKLRMRIAGGDGRAGEFAPAEGALALRLARRMVGLMGGMLAIERPAGGAVRLTVAVTLAIAESTAERVLDLAGRAVLIATDDSRFANDVAGLLAEWNAEFRWVGDGDAAVAELARGNAPERPVAIVDGRRRLLPALSLAHRAAQLGSDAPFILLVAEAGQVATLGDIDEGEIDGLVPAPVTVELLANALDGLPLMAATAMPRSDDMPRPEAPEAEIERVTPIAAHPKFVPETAMAIDTRALDELRALGGDAAFLDDLIETFDSDAQRIMATIEGAVAMGDAAGFARGLAALRRAAGPLGGRRLCEVLVSLHGLGAGELRRQGVVHVQRLGAEIDRLTTGLREQMPVAGVPTG